MVIQIQNVLDCLDNIAIQHSDLDSEKGQSLSFSENHASEFRSDKSYSWIVKNSGWSLDAGKAGVLS